MPTNHDSVAALPSAGGANHVLLRDLLVKRMAYVLTSAENSTDLVAVDPASGATILVLIQNGRVYALDPLDATTAHDGTTVLVSSDGKRYKLDTLVVPHSVIDKDLTAPPTSPEAAIGDSYLLFSPGTGAWAGMGPIVTLTARGWESVSLPIGRFLYVEDEDAYYHRDADGDIDSGLGISSISAGTLYPSHLLLGGGLVIWLVENQTTATPPGSPTEGDTYIGAPSSTDAWLGWDGSVIRFENGAWRRYEPSEGWRAYDKALNIQVVFDGTNWGSAAGAAVAFQRVFTASGSITQAGSAAYTFNATTAPTTTNFRRVDDIGITYTARRAGALLEFRYDATGTFGSSPAPQIITLFRDAETTSIDWTLGDIGDAAASANVPISVRLIVEAVDTSAHTYKIAAVATGTVAAQLFAAISRRNFTVTEYA